MLNKKIAHAKRITQDAIKHFDRVAIACSFGKDSMVVVHLARQVEPTIPIFSVMTEYKSVDTFKYLAEMDKLFALDTAVYMVSEHIPDELNDVQVELLPMKDFQDFYWQIFQETKAPPYISNPDECCHLLKIVPTRAAVANLDAWISGLRNTEGRARTDYHEVEEHGELMKINPILQFTEDEVWEYLRQNDIPPHPWYLRKFKDGQRYRSLGCAPCTHPVRDDELERAGRWMNTSKCGGECGIHTQALR